MTNYFGWQPSLLLRDLTSGTEWGAMNMHMNQAWADMQARSTLYMTPVMDFNCFTPYNSFSNNMNYLLDPNYAIAQWQWNNSNNGCNWGGFGMNGMNGMNWNNPWGSMGWNGGNTSGASSSAPSSASTPSERAFQRKYNKMLSLVKQLASDDSKLPPARKEALDEIAKHPIGKTYEEKFNNLEAEYDRVSKTEIEKFLASNASIKFGIDGKAATEANSFYGKLQQVGYEFTNSKVDSEISNLYDTISDIKDTQENYQNSGILADLAAKTGTYDILDVISSWNTQKEGSTGNDKRIITLIKEKYDALPAGEKGDAARSSVKTSVISPIVNGLLDRARGLKANLDSASQTKMANAMTKLENAYNNTKDKADSNLSKAFDDLYLLTRKAATAELRAEINEFWGVIDPDLFNNNLFEADIKKDLKAEGFNDAQIDAAKVTPLVAEDSGIYTQRVDETEPARKQLEAITGPDNALSKASSVTGIAGVTEAWIDNNTGKVYVLKQNSDGEDEIHEVSGVTVENGKVTATGSITTKKVNATDIATASETAKSEAEALKNEQDAVAALVANSDILTKQANKVKINGVDYDVYQETKGDKRQFVLVDGILYEYKNGAKGAKVSSSNIESAYNSALDEEKSLNSDKNFEGIEVARKLCSWTTKGDDEYIAGVLNTIDEDNIESFMKGIYSNSSFNHKGCEGLIEKLDDDTYASNGVTLDLKKQLINSFIAYAIKNGIDTNDFNIKYIKQGLEACTENGFNKHYSGWTWCGLGTNWNEKIDECMWNISVKLGLVEK